MSGSQVAVVTGSNKGIGYGIVKNLCEKYPGIVYLTSRDIGRGQQAIASLKQLGLQAEFHQLDVDSDESVKEFADFLKNKYGGIDLLVNNAGIAFKVSAKEPKSVQAEETVKTNYFGTLRVCEHLFPLLKPHARVVNISSMCGHLLQISDAALCKRFSDPNLTVDQLSSLMNEFIQAAKDGNDQDKGWPDSTYVVSKVGVSALTFIQHRQFLKDPREDIVINAVHPGYVSTDMSSHKGPLTIEEGSDAATYLALLPKGTTKPRGDFIWHNRQIVDWIKGPMPRA